MNDSWIEAIGDAPLLNAANTERTRAGTTAINTGTRAPTLHSTFGIVSTLRRKDLKQSLFVAIAIESSEIFGLILLDDKRV